MSQIVAAQCPVAHGREALTLINFSGGTGVLDLINFSYSLTPSGWGKDTLSSSSQLLLLNRQILSLCFSVLCLCQAGQAIWNYHHTALICLCLQSILHSYWAFLENDQCPCWTVCHTISIFENKLCGQTCYCSSGFLLSHILCSLCYMYLLRSKHHSCVQ